MRTHDIRNIPKERNNDHLNDIINAGMLITNVNKYIIEILFKYIQQIA